jgi:hypothetical protein
MRKSELIMLFLMGFMVVFTSCEVNPEVTPTSTEIYPTQTLEPSLPSQESNKKVCLWITEEVNPELIDITSQTLESLKIDYGFDLDIINGPIDLNSLSDYSVMVLIKPGQDFIEILNQEPGISYLVIDGVDLEPADNLTIIKGYQESLPMISFLGGYLAALITPDYRVGVIADDSNSDANLIIDSFTIGARYFCGLCNSRIGPIEYYPKYLIVNSEQTIEEWSVNLDSLILDSVQTVYLDQDILSSDRLMFISQLNIGIISSSVPSDASDLVNWIGTLSLNYQQAIIDVWPTVFNGASGMEVQPEIFLENFSEEKISEGRLRIFNETKTDLLEGLIKPVSFP